MSDLLQMVLMAPPGAKKTPLLVEIPVHPESAPFLVSGTKGWVWVYGAKGGVLRAATCKGSPTSETWVQVVTEVASHGQEAHWGNVFPCSESGIADAVMYLRSYGFDSVDVIVSPGWSPALPNGVKLSESSWMPSGKAVAVPSDRTYLGMLGMFGSGSYMVVVHNPSRGMAVMGDW